VIVPSRLAAAAFEGRLAEQGGALGVWVGTFDDLYHDLLIKAGQFPILLSEPVQRQIIRRAAFRADLQHYRELRGMPGFAEVLADLFRELKAGLITPEAFAEGLRETGRGPRLLELGLVYEQYQELLTGENFVDYLGAGWAARDALQAEPGLAAGWPVLLLDGFDDFPPLQLELLELLDQRVNTLEITLTGEKESGSRELVHSRFNRTRRQLVERLGCSVQVLPDSGAGDHDREPVLRELERGLFEAADQSLAPGNGLTMLAAPDREAEVRFAFRQIKTRLVREGLDPDQAVVLCRSLKPYRPYLKPIADEFGIPVRVLGGQPVLENPAAAALLDLLQLTAPGENRFNWQGVVEAWRSPYFDWTCALVEGKKVDIRPGEAEDLATAARWGSVLAGEDQWREIFEVLSGMKIRPGPWDEEYPEVPERLPIGQEAAALGETFDRFVDFIDPPEGEHALQDFTRWLENLIAGPESGDGSSSGLNLVGQIREAPPDLVDRDLSALKALKNTLRGLVWAEEAAGLEPVSYGRFLEELNDALTGAAYQSERTPAEAVLAAEVTQARGLSFRFAALLGLAEGEFPAPAAEDPFLRDEDRRALREQQGLALRPSTESAEAGYFYEAVSRPTGHLVLTRPRIADNGAPWQPSPFWEEILRRVEITPRGMTTRTRLSPDECASWQELFEQAADESGPELWAWAAEQQPDQAVRIDLAARILRERTRSRDQPIGPYDGGLAARGELFADRFQPERIWSSSRLESYRTCPYFFYTASVLNLEPTEPPREGLDARQLGNIYHRILEELYRLVGEDPALEDLLEALPGVAEEILETAPRVEGFRETAWWEETRKIILENLRRSIEVLETLEPAYGFYRSEQSFGITRRGGPALVVKGRGADYFKLRGFIDRVDRTGDGRVRVVDYKTSSPYSFTNSALRRGKKLQLPLYALAAQEALELGLIAEGFYFHVQHAQASGLQLSRFSLDGSRGPEAAMDHGVQMAWEAVRGARSGDFVPRAPADGCPGYCPAAAYCWHFNPVYW
jgi:ATP-dependent helicase/DNAse subunit B